jgi:hypothetical protein
MSRPSFRPQLELLELRDAPASLQAINNTVNSDFNTLKTDVNTLVGSSTLVAVASNAQPVANDNVTLQNDFNTLKSTTTQTQNFLLLGTFVAFQQGQLGNPIVDIILFAGFSQVNTANNTIKSLPNQVSSLGTQTLTNFPPATVNNAVQLFTSHGPLSLS